MINLLKNQELELGTCFSKSYQKSAFAAISIICQSWVALLLHGLESQHDGSSQCAKQLYSAWFVDWPKFCFGLDSTIEISRSKRERINWCPIFSESVQNWDFQNSILLYD